MGGLGAIGVPGLIIILVIVLIVFGPKNYQKSVERLVKRLQNLKSLLRDLWMMMMIP